MNAGFVSEIVQHPARVLLTPTREVSEFGDVPPLAERMFAAMRKFRGMGLAANQIGVGLRVAVMHVPGWPEMVLVNPRIVRTKGETTNSEGCLSVQKSRHWVPVKRAKIVYVEYQDATGAAKKLKAADMLARCIQHELDHLDGVTCLERTEEIAI